MTTTQSDRVPAKRLMGALVVLVVGATLGSWFQSRPAMADATFNSKMLDLVNQQRANAGIAPLQFSASLSSVAEDGQYSGCGFGVQGRSKDMGVRNYFSHTIAGCGTQGAFNMLGAAGIQYSAAGENIAWMNGTTDPLVAAERLTNDLMASPDHKANILNSNFTHIGIGSWTSPAGQSWTGGGSALTRVWIATQVFAGMTATSAPTTAVTPSGLAFADTTVGSLSAVHVATVANTGNAPLTVSGVALSGANAGDFSIASNGCGTIQAGGSCTIGVAFKPLAAGTRSGALTITDNAAGSPRSTPLTGAGVAVVAPGGPTNVVIAPANAALSANWNAPAAAGSVDGYGMYVYDGDNHYTGRSAWVCATCTSGTVTGLTNGQWYYAVVYSHSVLGWGGYTFSSTGVVVGTAPAPTNVVATKGNGQVSVSWAAPAAGSGIDSFALLAYDSNGYAYLYSFPCATCTTGVVTGLTNGRTYTIAAYSHTAAGWSAATVSNQFVPSP
jgi:uncharacterized protein YkwD